MIKLKDLLELNDMTYNDGPNDKHLGRINRVVTMFENVLLEISDNGIGLPQDRSRLFEPYVTTREKGTGLGLAIVKKIVEEHGGVLNLEDSTPFENGDIVGASVSINLPKSKKQSD